MVVVGEVIRKLAIITTGHAFTHLIQRYHEEHHKLVTHGVYSIVRHPGQLVLKLCCYFLRQFFGEYEEFAKRVPSGIPFVK
ncbi:putative protein-S-isoprenylcysteine O-methyltransferase [Helianthus anomalus]